MKKVSRYRFCPNISLPNKKINKNEQEKKKKIGKWVAEKFYAGIYS